MNRNQVKVFSYGCGCAGFSLLLLLAIVLIMFPAAGFWAFESTQGLATEVAGPFQDGTPQPTPTLIQAEIPPAAVGTPAAEELFAPDFDRISSDYLNQFYQIVSPGVVSIYVINNGSIQAGTGAGSGFVFDNDGHIVTNNHVVAGADFVMVIFQDGRQEKAEIIGTDPDSDLAVIRVEEMPESAVPLPIGSLDTVLPGDWVIAIGNPFGLKSSMTLGIVSAVGRAIPSGATPFAIPLAIQTDAAINPGNSGGPLLNLEGQVIGVNAQIASGSGANSGVGFAIPSDIVRRVVPSLIEVGVYQWSWLGVRGTSVDLFIEEANNLPVDRGAYLVEVIQDGPADLGGLRGSTGSAEVNGFDVPVGGDVIIAADGTPIESYADLQIFLSEQPPGTTVSFSVLRNGETVEIPVELAPRPEQ